MPPRFQSTHPLRGATEILIPEVILEIISIHAPLAGCDVVDQTAAACRVNFNPRTPCGVRQGADKALNALNDFNPRTPCGVRQGSETQRLCSKQFQSTHPLRGATKAKHGQQDSCHISIHAPLAGCDLCRRFNASCIGYFNPRTPCGVRLARPAAMTGCAGFQSTHPLRGATSSSTRMRGTGTFQSTHPLRGATRIERVDVGQR